MVKNPRIKYHIHIKKNQSMRTAKINVRYNADLFMDLDLAKKEIINIAILIGDNIISNR